MALVLDGSAHSNQTSASPTVTLSTSNSNDVIILFITSNPGTVVSVAGGGLTWNLRSSVNSAGNVLTYYYAIAASPLSSAVITATMSASTFTTMDAFGISGANTGSPFDGSVVTATGTVAQITTTNANDMIIGGFLTTDVAGSGYTLVPACVTADFQMAEYQIVSATQTALNVDTAGTAATLSIADAIKQASTSTLVTGWQNSANDIAPRRALAFSAPPAFGRAIPAPTNTNAGIPWFEPPDERAILYVKPQKISASPAFLPPIPVVTWAFGASDTIFLREAPIDVAPGFGRAIVSSVTISGISWFEPPDRDCPAIKIRFESPPALALTPSTLPVPIRGMAWFEIQDRQFPARIQSVESPPSAFGRALPANVGISGIGWFEPPDVIRFGRQVGFDVPPTLPAPVVTVTWSFVVPDVFSPRRAPMDAPPAFGRSVPAVGVSGIGWLVPPDRDPPQVKVRVESAPSTVFSPAALPSIGMAWFEQPDRARLATVWRLDAPPAFGRSVTTAGVTVSGMAWFVSLDRDRPPLKMSGDTSMAMGFLGISFGPPSFTITRHLSTYGVDLDITMLPDGTPQPYIPSTDGTPWPPA